MDSKVVIDCIGPSVLTITIGGAAHSVSLATDVIRINGPDGATEHNIDSLPLVYDTAALGGRLNICDGAGKMVYCWRSAVMLQSMPSAAHQGRVDRSSSKSLGPTSRREMITPNSGRTFVSSGQLGKSRSTSVLKSNTSRMSTASSAATLTHGGTTSNDMTDFQHSTSDDIVEEPFIEPEGPVNEELLVRFGRHLQSLRRKRDFEELRNKVICAQCGKDPDASMVTSCLHLYCSKCLKSLEYEAAEKDPYGTHCAACDDVIVESQSCQRLEELGIDAFLSLGGSPGKEVGQRYIDLEAEEPRQQSPTITAVQQSFLVHAINKLMKLSYGEFFRQPVPADDARYPTYIGITIPIDLKTMRDKLRASAYASIEMLKADFDRMVQNSRAWNGAAHQDTKDAQNLKVAFERYMAEYPEQDEKDVAPRKKAKKTRELKTISGHDPTRAAASSPPRAAKIAMQRQRYPRDHW